MAGLHEISAEILRITQCPYTPSLKRLHELLQDTNERLLHRWARNQPCQVASLAASVLEGLEYWPFALHLLQILAWVPAFRDAALQQKPVLLNNLLSRAMESDSGFDKFAPVCASLLSSPLEAAIPSSVPVFLQRLLENAVRSVSPDTIRPIHQILSALDPSYLDDLAPDVLARFQKQLEVLLVKIDPSKPFGIHLCLAVFARLATRPVKETTNHFLLARKYFVGRRAPKTCDLAVFSVISACSINIDLGLDEALETLRLSRDIVNALHSDDKRAWLEQPTHVERIKKLYEKILRPNIESTIQLSALDFVVALCDGQSLPRELQSTYEKAFSVPEGATLSPQALGVCIRSFDAPIFHESLTGILRLACETKVPSSNGLIRLENALHTVTAMAAATFTNEHIDQIMLDVISSGLLYQFAIHEPSRAVLDSRDCPKEVCSSTYLETLTQLQQRLVVTVLSMLLRSPTSAQGCEAISTILLEKQTQLSTNAITCAGCNGVQSAQDQSPLSLFEAGSTPRSNTISHNWRESLVRGLSRDATRDYESVMRMVGEVCRDLELRCDEAERPYREEQSKSRDLEIKLDVFRTRAAELEVQLRVQSANIGDLEIEKDVVLNKARTSEEHRKHLAEELERTQEELNEVKHASEKGAQAALEISRDQDLAYLAILTGKDEILEEHAVKLTTSEAHISDLEDQVAELTTKVAKLTESISTNETTIQELNDCVAAANDSVATKQDEIDRLIESEAALSANAQDAAARAQQVCDQKDSTVSGLRNQLEASESKVKEITREYHTFTNTKAAEIAKLGVSHKQSSEILQAQLETIRNDAAVAKEESTSKIASLHTKVKKLRNEREEKGRKLAEAQELYSRIAAVMGHTNVQDHHATAKSQSSPFAADDVLSDGGICPEKQAIEATPCSPLASRTSSISGPTPKRTKTRRTPQVRRTQGLIDFKAPTIAKANRRHTMRSGRTPLADLGPTHNLGSFSPTQRISWEKPTQNSDGQEAVQENQGVREFNSDDESFGGEDIFTSTDQQQLFALRGKTPKTPQRPKEYFDETTTEF